MNTPGPQTLALLRAIRRLNIHQHVHARSSILEEYCRLIHNDLGSALSRGILKPHAGKIDAGDVCEARTERDFRQDSCTEKYTFAAARDHRP